LRVKVRIRVRVRVRVRFRVRLGVITESGVTRSVWHKSLSFCWTVSLLWLGLGLGLGDRG
jgi:hypothetical protein